MESVSFQTFCQVDHTFRTSLHPLKGFTVKKSFSSRARSPPKRSTRRLGDDGSLHGENAPSTEHRPKNTLSNSKKLTKYPKKQQSLSRKSLKIALVSWLLASWSDFEVLHFVVSPSLAPQTKRLLGQVQMPHLSQWASHAWLQNHQALPKLLQGSYIGRLSKAKDVVGVPSHLIHQTHTTSTTWPFCKWHLNSLGQRVPVFTGNLSWTSNHPMNSEVSVSPKSQEKAKSLSLFQAAAPDSPQEAESMTKESSPRDLSKRLSKRRRSVALSESSLHCWETHDSEILAKARLNH